MTQTFSLLPESAPFNEEQRAWLNGFLAGWIGLHSEGAAGASPLATVQSLSDVPNGKSSEAPADDETFPWHDPALPLDERLRLAEGKPLPRLMMAAMAQLDCGTCGYNCQRYAEAIVSGEEKSLKLCTPGGKETAKLLKELFTKPSAAGSNGHTNGHSNGHTPGGTAAHDILDELTGHTSNGHAVWSRHNPYHAPLRLVRELNGDGSAKRTSHVEIDLAGSGLTYHVGDSLGVYPSNCPDLVSRVLQALGATGNEMVVVDEQTLPLSTALAEKFCLSEITDELIERLLAITWEPEHQEWLRQVKAESDLVDGWDVLEFLTRISTPLLRPAELLAVLSPLKPRLYSISSSLKACPDQVHLTVGRVAWEFQGRHRKGVASTMFADRLEPGSRVRVFVQPSHGFTVPQDPTTPVIMIGPGTGIAPFRAFLQERRATEASGKNWLFFGDQRSTTDFLYREELEELRECGLLTRLDCAFSRDQEAKVYVQHRMVEQGAEIWKWLQDGAHIYVCGDAKRMAVDVDQALRQIIRQHGMLDQTTTSDFMTTMIQSKRYCRDVY
jgi:sulfite reductase (NADPH) flavoprotein alpha-component